MSLTITKHKHRRKYVAPIAEIEEIEEENIMQATNGSATGGDGYGEGDNGEIQDSKQIWGFDNFSDEEDW